MSIKNTKKMTDVIFISKDDLPLSCPRDDYLKLSHPKIFLPIEKQINKIIQCPYCSTIYQLSEENIT